MGYAVIPTNFSRAFGSDFGQWPSNSGNSEKTIDEWFIVRGDDLDTAVVELAQPVGIDLEDG